MTKLFQPSDIPEAFLPERAPPPSRQQDLKVEIQMAEERIASLQRQLKKEFTDQAKRVLEFIKLSGY